MTKTPEQKALEKQTKQEKDIAQKTQRRERAAQIIGSAKYINGFRIMDPDSESALKVALETYSGNDSNRVAVTNDSVPKHLRYAVMQECENLLQYGMLADYMSYGNSVMMTLSTQGKSYFDDKEAAVKREPERTEDDEKMSINKPNKVFISHSSQDKDYVKLFAELLEDIGLPEGSIICTSVPEYGIPNDQRIYDWLRYQFLNCELRVIYVLSKNYYNSPACLNEMGAAWVTKSTDTIVLLPGFSFSDIKGCVDGTKIGIDLGGDEAELKVRLGGLKDNLIREFGLANMTEAKWERHRDDFIRKINEVAETSPKSESDSNNPSYTVQSTMVMKNSDYIPLEVSFLVVYALKDDGVINYIKVDNGEIISAGGYNFTPTQSAREIAKWREALDTLVEWKWVTKEGGDQFKLTNTGFNWADGMKENMHIDTDKDPLEQMKEFD